MSDVPDDSADNDEDAEEGGPTVTQATAELFARLRKEAAAADEDGSAEDAA